MGVPTFVAGKIGQAIGLNPADGSNDYVDCGNPSQLNFGMGDWSICAWVKTTQAVDTVIVFGNGGDQSGGIRYMLAIGEDEPEGAVSVTTDRDSPHVIGLRNGTALRVYVDGVLDGTNILPADYDLSGTVQHNAYIGAVTDHEDASGQTLHKYFIGLIDDLRIYDYAPSPAEIGWLAGRTKPFDKPF